MVQRYGKNGALEIAQLGYSAYHKYGISPYFFLSPIILLGKLMQKTAKHLEISWKSGTFVTERLKQKDYVRRKRDFKKE